MKRIVSFGGGSNSTAVLINMVKHQLIPDEILFADTGGEHPHTYKFLAELNNWLMNKNFPTIKTLKYKNKNGDELTLEQDCLNNNTIPPIAFGWKTCSQKFKIAPIEKYIKQQYPNDKIQIWVGFDANEERRIKANPNKNFENYYPLIEWGWDRDKCIEVIAKAGLTLPGKSSCFFCPNMKKHEILKLDDDLKERVMAMEKNATKLAELKGLGRNKSWTELINADRAQLKLEWDVEDWHTPACECIE
jgi:hypothetical protein